jgi:hypothetical protein
MLKVDAMMSYGNPVSTVQTLLFYGWNPKEEGRLDSDANPTGGSALMGRMWVRVSG